MQLSHRARMRTSYPWHLYDLPLDQLSPGVRREPSVFRHVVILIDRDAMARETGHS